MAEPKQEHDTSSWPVPKHGQFVWTEIASSDAEKCMEFYKNVFGWSFQNSNAATDGMDYREFSTGGPGPAGGLYEIDPEFFGGNPPPPHFLTYVAVDDVDANAAKAVELGATIIRGPMDIPNVGRMCIFQDPTGGMLATFKMKSPQD